MRPEPGPVARPAGVVVNLLVHLYLAERTGTSAAGQILGDMVKGRLDGRHGAAVERGIRLHRGIDRVSDDHEAHRAMRRRFPPPLRRYAGILVDIGFDYSLARAWPAACTAVSRPSSARSAG